MGVILFTRFDDHVENDKRTIARDVHFLLAALILFSGVRLQAQESYRNPAQRGVSLIVEGFAGANVKIGGGTQGRFVPLRRFRWVRGCAIGT